MIDDINRTTRLIASSPDDATLADGERVVWRLDKGAYADTFGRIQFVAPDPLPPTPEAALVALRAQAAAGVGRLEAGEQAALFTRLQEQKAAGLTECQTLFIVGRGECPPQQGDRPGRAPRRPPLPVVRHGLQRLGSRRLGAVRAEGNR